MSQTRYTLICTNTKLSLIATQGCTQPSIQVYSVRCIDIQGNINLVTRFSSPPAPISGGRGVASTKCKAQAQIFRHAPDLTVIP